MKNNLSHLECSSNVMQTNELLCHQCLINHIEKQEFDLGVAPDDHYVSNQFMHGDVVVLKQLNILDVTDLITLIRFDGQYWETDHRIGCIHESSIRVATTAELNAKQRLDNQSTQFVTEAS